jgi:hypothetical protein
MVYLGHMSGAAYCGQGLPQHLRRLRHRTLVCSPWLSMFSCVIEQAPVGAQVTCNLDDAQLWRRGSLGPPLLFHERAFDLSLLHCLNLLANTDKNAELSPNSIWMA